MGKWIEVQVEPSFTVSSIVLRLAQVGRNIINPLQANILLVCFKTSVDFSEDKIFPSSHSLPNVKLQKCQKLQTSNHHVLSLASLSPRSNCFQVGLPPSRTQKVSIDARNWWNGALHGEAPFQNGRDTETQNRARAELKILISGWLYCLYPTSFMEQVGILHK